MSVHERLQVRTLTGETIKEPLKKGWILCTNCRDPLKKTEGNKCSCGAFVCELCVIVCPDCGRSICCDCTEQCSDCESLICGDCLESCKGCGTKLCAGCQTHCEICTGMNCLRCMVDFLAMVVCQGCSAHETSITREIEKEMEK